MSKFHRYLCRGAGLVLAVCAFGATAAEPAGNSALSSVQIEADAAVPAAPQARVPMSRASREAARDALRQRVTRMNPPDGSTIYRYNGIVREQLVLTRDADGTTHVMCTDATHEHGTAPVREASDVR